MTAPDAGTVDVWVARPPELSAGADWPRLEALLTDEDRAKRDRFHFEANRREYAVTRALARLVLGDALDVDPESLVFGRTDRGRPFLVPDRGLRFNLANHPTTVVCAVATAEVGVDVEPVGRGPEILTVTHTVFSDEERSMLDALPQPEKEARAVSLWTAKEAYLKARGMGLSMPLPRISLRFATHDAPTLHLEPPADDDATRWSLRLVDVDGHRIAVCAEGVLRSVNIRSIDLLLRS
jgi:4'-phosphopantetheinyl transferase